MSTFLISCIHLIIWLSSACVEVIGMPVVAVVVVLVVESNMAKEVRE